MQMIWKYVDRHAAKSGSACTIFTSFSQKNCQCNYKIKCKNFQIRKKNISNWQNIPAHVGRNKGLPKVHPNVLLLDRCPNQSHKPKLYPWKHNKSFSDGTATEITDYLTAVLRLLNLIDLHSWTAFSFLNWSRLGQSSKKQLCKTCITAAQTDV